jgi:hypothetical protein
LNALAVRKQQPVMRTQAQRWPAPRSGSGTAMQTAAGAVSAVFALETFDRRSGVATYSLRVLNYTTSALVCQAWAITQKGRAVLAYPVAIDVAPNSELAMQVPVVLPALPRFDRALVEVAGQDVHCLVEAAAPAGTGGNRGYAIAATSLLTGALALGGAVGLWPSIPRIDAFAVPPQALAGTTVRAEYDVRGSGRLWYTVAAPNGKQIQGGLLTDRSGTIPISIPPSRDAGAYTVQMALSGPLGEASATRVLTTLPERPRSEAQIGSISVSPIVVRPGQTVNVAYSAVGDGGYVRLMGADGTIWGQQSFSKHGLNTFVVPPVRDGELHLVLHVTRGHSSAQSMAGLVVATTTPATANAAPAQAIVGDDDPNAVQTTTDSANGTFDVLTKSVPSGGTIQVKVFSPRNGMRISLMDSQGHEVTGADVGAQATVVNLQAPSATVPTRYVVEASFTDGFGQETVVEPVTVVP